MGWVQVGCQGFTTKPTDKQPTEWHRRHFATTTAQGHHVEKGHQVAGGVWLGAHICPPPRRQPLALPWQDLHICDPQALIPAACVCACSVRVIAHQLRINLSEGRVAQIMGRGPYRVWFKGIDYPGGHQRAHGINACSSAAAAWTLTTASQPDSSTIWIPHCTHQLGVERCM